MAPAPGAAKPSVERETPTSAVINANQSPGMLAAVTAADLAVKKVKSQDGPIAIVGAYNTGTSSGQLAFYCERIAKKGFIGIAIANFSNAAIVERFGARRVSQSAVFAFDAETGEVAWKIDRFGFIESHGTPYVWRNADREELRLLVHRRPRRAVPPPWAAPSICDVWRRG